MTASNKMFVPTDANGNVLNRSMGIPVASKRFVTSHEHWCDLIDLSDYGARVFIGMNIKNTSGLTNVMISFDEEDVGDETENIIVGPQEAHAYDNLTFGPGVNDFSTGTRTRKIRVKLDGSSDSGSLSSATIVYGANPSDEQTVKINGNVYEFSADQSVAPGRIKVDIGADADETYTNLINAIAANDGNAVGEIDTATSTVTIYCTKGGTDGDGMEVADGDVNPTGATFSGNTTGGSGGISVVVNIW